MHGPREAVENKSNEVLCERQKSQVQQQVGAMEGSMNG